MEDTFTFRSLPESNAAASSAKYFLTDFMFRGNKTPHFFASHRVEGNCIQSRRGEIHEPVNNDRIGVHVWAVWIIRMILPYSFEPVNVSSVDLGYFGILIRFFIAAVDCPICVIIVLVCRFVLSNMI